MSFASRLKSLRQERNISIEALAGKIGVSAGRISDWENGKTYPHSNFLIALSEFFEVPVHFLLKGEEAPSLDNLTTIGKRIRFLREYKNLTMSGLAAQLRTVSGIKASSGLISDWENEKTSPSAEALIALSTFFDVSIDWILTGKYTRSRHLFFEHLWESISLSDNETSNSNNRYVSLSELKGALRKYYLAIQKLPKEDIQLLNSFIDRFIARGVVIQLTQSPQPHKAQEVVKIPIIGAAAAGQPIEAIRFLEGYISVPGDTSKYRNCFAIRVRGDSMKNAGIQDGGYVIVRQQPTVETNEIALVMIDNEVTIKRLKLVNDTAVLISENDNYKPMIYKQAADMVILGKVIKYIPPEEAEIEETFDY